MGFTERQRHLAIVSIERYIDDIRKACKEDQGTPEGKPGTVGHDTQIELKDTLKVLRGE
jgi:hypothetical protein